MKRHFLPILTTLLALFLAVGLLPVRAVEMAPTDASYTETDETAAEEVIIPESTLHIIRGESAQVTQDDTELSFITGEQLQLRSYSNSIEITSIIRWSSSDETVVTVEDGLVTAVGYGACYITARIGIVEAEWSVSVTPAQVTLAQPVRVSAGQVALRWEKVSEISGYQLYRATEEDGVYFKIKTISAEELAQYTNTVVRNNRYFYKIRAYYKMEDGTYIYGAWSDIKDIGM